MDDWTPRIKCYECMGTHALTDVEIRLEQAAFGGQVLERFDCPGKEQDDK